MTNTDTITNALRFGFKVNEGETMIFSMSEDKDASDTGTGTRKYYGIKQAISTGINLTDGFLTSTDSNVEEVTATKVTDSNKICELTANSVQKVTVYIWLEGQDKDCTDANSNGGGNNAIGFNFSSLASST